MDENEGHHLKARIRRLERIVFGGERPELDKRDHARSLLDYDDNGNLDEAGKILGIERAHAGKEDDESYKRRLSAAVHGADKADATKPRPSTVEAATAEEDAGKAEDGEAEPDPILTGMDSGGLAPPLTPPPVPEKVPPVEEATTDAS